MSITLRHNGYVFECDEPEEAVALVLSLESARQRAAGWEAAKPGARAPRQLSTSAKHRATDTGETRTCPVCEQTKPITEFDPMGRGRRRTCRECEDKKADRGQAKCAECGRQAKTKKCDTCGARVCSLCWGPHYCEVSVS